VQKKSTGSLIKSTSMKRKSLIEAVPPEARDSIQAKFAFVSQQLPNHSIVEMLCPLAS
jgi:hypothetical protein